MIDLQRFTDMAACYRFDYDGNIDTSRDWIWFPRGKNNGPSPAKRLAAAQDICAVCPILHECFESALIEGERDAIRGGVDFGARELRKLGVERREKRVRYRFGKFTESP